jgi:hypothetical protein
VQHDRLSEFVQGSITEAVQTLGRNESITWHIAEKEGIKITVARQDKITFWQAFLTATWFPILVAGLAAFLWSRDQNSVVIHYVRDNLTVTATGLFAGWILSMVVVVYLFRYIRNS